MVHIYHSFNAEALKEIFYFHREMAVFSNTYPLDSVLFIGLNYLTFEQPGAGA